MFSSARQWSPLLARDADATQRIQARSRSVAASFDVQRQGSPPVVLIVAGTRPECIKLVPIVRRLTRHERLRVILVNSGQHRLAVNRTFAEFDIRCNIELSELPRFDWLGASHDHLRVELRAVLERIKPALTVVQGDTLTAYSGARAAHDTSTLLAHVEAGLRTDTISDPFPEEWFRRRISHYASIHFAPSFSATRNLLAEGADRRTVHQVGNTGIDSLRTLLAEIGPAERIEQPARGTVLVTLHRRENHDRNAGIVCDALVALTKARPDLRVLFPIHPNPRVAEPIRRRLETHPAFDLVAPMTYRDFIFNAAGAALIISDSGGIQEEAPHLGTQLLVPRSNTERPEGVETGWVQLVRVDCAAIVEASLERLAAPRMRPVPIDARAPFGDGNAADRIVHIVEQALLKRSYA
jgi:UDP-N-acetylglucosamine 2-epimerase (non-hydrolysing)